jgi:hypothetical protein
MRRLTTKIDHILRERRRHLRIQDVQFFRGAGYDTDHYLMVAKVREGLKVSIQEAQKFHVED